MDTYIKMCEESEEIQKLFEFKMGDWFIHTDYMKTEHWIVLEESIVSVSVINTYKKEGVIWIPTEEQLQEIAMTLGSLQGRVMQPFWELVDQFNYFIFGDETRKYVSQFKSFKEFWFAFVMKEKYHKIWDGKTWIKGT